MGTRPSSSPSQKNHVNEKQKRNSKKQSEMAWRRRTQHEVFLLKVGEKCYIEDQFEILEEEKKFYESLYRSTNINPKHFKNSPYFNPENVSVLSADYAFLNPFSFHFKQFIKIQCIKEG